jgi:hypothetical protein
MHIRPGPTRGASTASLSWVIRSVSATSPSSGPRDSNCGFASLDDATELAARRWNFDDMAVSAACCGPRLTPVGRSKRDSVLEQYAATSLQCGPKGQLNPHAWSSFQDVPRLHFKPSTPTGLCDGGKTPLSSKEQPEIQRCSVLVYGMQSKS